jgi:hypothetical protein
MQQASSATTRSRSCATSLPPSSVAALGCSGCAVSPAHFQQFRFASTPRCLSPLPHSVTMIAAAAAAARRVAVRSTRRSFASSAAALPTLDYGYDALQPAISAQIMEIHHSKHHATYINNYNAAIETYADAERRGDIAGMIALQGAIKFNGGGAFPLPPQSGMGDRPRPRHQSLAPPQAPNGRVLAASTLRMAVGSPQTCGTSMHSLASRMHLALALRSRHTHTVRCWLRQRPFPTLNGSPSPPHYSSTYCAGSSAPNASCAAPRCFAEKKHKCNNNKSNSNSNSNNYY